MESKAMAVICLNSATDYSSSETLMEQTAQLIFECLNHGIEIVGFISAHGVKSYLRRIKNIDRKKRFNKVVIYSPHMVAKNAQEYLEFVRVLKEEFKADVVFYRA